MFYIIFNGKVGNVTFFLLWQPMKSIIYFHRSFIQKKIRILRIYGPIRNIWIKDFQLLKSISGFTSKKSGVSWWNITVIIYPLWPLKNKKLAAVSCPKFISSNTNKSKKLLSFTLKFRPLQESPTCPAGRQRAPHDLGI